MGNYPVTEENGKHFWFSLASKAPCWVAVNQLHLNGTYVCNSYWKHGTRGGPSFYCFPKLCIYPNWAIKYFHRTISVEKTVQREVLKCAFLHACLKIKTLLLTFCLWNYGSYKSLASCMWCLLKEERKIHKVNKDINCKTQRSEKWQNLIIRSYYFWKHYLHKMSWLNKYRFL